MEIVGHKNAVLDDASSFISLNNLFNKIKI